MSIYQAYSCLANDTPPAIIIPGITDYNRQPTNFYLRQIDSTSAGAFGSISQPNVYCLKRSNNNGVATLQPHYTFDNPLSCQAPLMCGTAQIGDGTVYACTIPTANVGTTGYDYDGAAARLSTNGPDVALYDNMDDCQTGSTMAVLRK